MGDEHWRTRKVPQVSWFINEMYNDFNVDAFSRTTIHQIGDELDGEHLLNVSKPFSPWETVKKSEKLNKPELFKLLKDSSERTFTTRVIFMKWIHLRDKKDRKTAVGFYTSFKQQMEDTMKGQLLVMSGDQNTNNKDLVKKHSNCFNELVRKEKDMHEKVSSLELSLGKAEEQRQEAEEQRQEAIKQIEEAIEQKDKAIEQKEEAIEQKQEAIEQKLESERAYDQLSDMFDELCARKAKLDQVTKQKRQQRDLSEVSHNGNPDKQEDMNHAQVCSTNPVQVTTQDNQKPKKENEITLVDI